MGPHVHNCLHKIAAVLDTLIFTKDALYPFSIMIFHVAHHLIDHFSMLGELLSLLLTFSFSHMII